MGAMTAVPMADRATARGLPVTPRSDTIGASALSGPALDAAILFSDILTVPDAMGLGLEVLEGEGPRFERTVRSRADVEGLARPDPEVELRYVMDAVRLIRRELAGRVPLIGFAGSPWTLATYMIEGRGSSDFHLAKGLVYGDPATAHRLLERLTEAVTAYLSAQVAAGAEALMVFDTWGGVLSPRCFREFSLRYLARIVEGLPREAGGRRVPVVLFTKGGGGWLEDLAATGCDALGVDWTLDLADARRRVGDRVGLQGNLDPGALYASPEALRAEVGRVLDSYGPGPGHVFNLGHGVQKHVDPERVGVLVDAVHELGAGRAAA